MELIGINGLMGSGKDTTYGFIAELHPGALRVAFADKLKIMAAMAFGLEGTPANLIYSMNEAKEHWEIEVYDRRLTLKARTFTGRQYLQWLGAKAREVFGDTFWIDQVLPPKRTLYAPEKADTGVVTRSVAGSYMGHDALAERYPDTDLVVVTDVRYPNEAERILELGGEVWEILRPSCTSDGHSSEIPLSRELITREVHNDGDLDVLASRVEEALRDGPVTSPSSP